MNPRCQDLHRFPVPTLSLPPLCHIILIFFPPPKGGQGHRGGAGSTRGSRQHAQLWITVILPQNAWRGAEGEHVPITLMNWDTSPEMQLQYLPHIPHFPLSNPKTKKNPLDALLAPAFFPWAGAALPSRPCGAVLMRNFINEVPAVISTDHLRFLPEKSWVWG